MNNGNVKMGERMIGTTIEGLKLIKVVDGVAMFTSPEKQASILQARGGSRKSSLQVSNNFRICHPACKHTRFDGVGPKALRRDYPSRPERLL